MTRPFPLKGTREGKVKQTITAQTMLPNNYSRDSLIAALKTKGKAVAQFRQTSLSVNLKY